MRSKYETKQFPIRLDRQNFSIRFASLEMKTQDQI